MGGLGGIRRSFPTSRHQVRKANVLIVNLPRDIRDSKKSFYVYVSDRSKTRENVGLFQKRKIKQETLLACLKKAEVLNKFFCKCSSYTTRVTEDKGQDWEHEDLCAVGENQA